MERIKIQIRAATGMRDEERMKKLAALMQAEAKSPLDELTDEALRRLARANHGPLLAAEAAAKKARINDGQP